MRTVPIFIPTQTTIQNPLYDVASNVFNELGSLGKFIASLSMAIVTIITSLMIIVGIYFIYTDDNDKYLHIDGNIIETVCEPTTIENKDKKATNNKCNIVVEYLIDGKAYSKKIYVAGVTKYIENEPIRLMVSNSNYNDVQLAYTSKSAIGGLLIIVASGIFGLGYLNYYLTHTYDIYSKIYGTSTILSIF